MWLFSRQIAHRVSFMVSCFWPFLLVSGDVTITIQETNAGVTFTVEPNGSLDGRPGLPTTCPSFPSNIFQASGAAFGLFPSQAVADCYFIGSGSFSRGGCVSFAAPPPPFPPFASQITSGVGAVIDLGGLGTFLAVPSGYMFNGDPFPTGSVAATYPGETIASLGLQEGTCEINWFTQGTTTQENLVNFVVLPVPSSSPSNNPTIISSSPSVACSPLSSSTSSSASRKIMMMTMRMMMKRRSKKSIASSESPTNLCLAKISSGTKSPGKGRMKKRRSNN